jgi:serine protease
MVLGYTNYSSVRLLGNLGATSGAVVIGSGAPVPDLSGGAGSFRMFSILVPGGATSLAVTLDGPNGDADLYIRQGSFPLLNQYDQASFDTGSNESVLQPSPVAGIWFIRVEGFDAFTGATLTATVTLAPAVVAAR